MSVPFPASDHDYFILATTIYGEARGEPQEAQIAVGWTVRNRAQRVLDNGGPKIFGDGSLAASCLFPWQYSCHNANTPESAAMADLTVDSTDPVFQECMLTADEVISGIVDDPTSGSCWYYDDSIGFPAAWGPEIPPTCTIGRLHFFNKLGE